MKIIKIFGIILYVAGLVSAIIFAITGTMNTKTFIVSYSVMVSGTALIVIGVNEIENRKSTTKKLKFK